MRTERPFKSDHAVTREPHRLLEISHVEKIFPGDVVALRDMSLQVNQGDFISLLGPSGCGKSTVLRLIAGLLGSDSGSITWQGGQRDGDLGMVFQAPTLMPWARVIDNVFLPLRLRGESFRHHKQELMHTLELVGLEQFASAYPRELSGGMKMRVSIARALITRPRLILMDEPFASLDEITRLKMNSELLSLQEQIGCTVVFVTHSVSEAIFLSNRVIVMAARPGRVIRELTIDLQRPRTIELATTPEFSIYTQQVLEALQLSMASES